VCSSDLARALLLRPSVLILDDGTSSVDVFAKANPGQQIVVSGAGIPTASAASNGGSYLYAGSRSIDDYLNLAGGPTRGADQASVFVIRANGSVVSSPQGDSWFSNKRDLATVKAVPGDTVFVPEQIGKTTWVQDAKDWTQIIYQLGLGFAGIAAVFK
jgi:protein involved in polysaccharide export with SLBB domain